MLGPSQTPPPAYLQAEMEVEQGNVCVCVCIHTCAHAYEWKGDSGHSLSKDPSEENNSVITGTRSGSVKLTQKWGEWL